MKGAEAGKMAARLRTEPKPVTAFQDVSGDDANPVSQHMYSVQLFEAPCTWKKEDAAGSEYRNGLAAPSTASPWFSLAWLTYVNRDAHTGVEAEVPSSVAHDPEYMIHILWPRAATSGPPRPDPKSPAGGSTAPLDSKYSVTAWDWYFGRGMHVDTPPPGVH
jgi:hypothetical protein